VIKTLANRTAKGPYSTVVQAGPFVFLSGQGAFDPETGEVVPGGIEEQTKQTLENIRALLAEAGLGVDRLVQVTCYLTDLDDWPRMNEAYAAALGESVRPTRTAVGVAALPFGLLVEITAVAYAG
jgi:2-iminobutanoate/2-iminopropanoate deaminase